MSTLLFFLFVGFQESSVFPVRLSEQTSMRTPTQSLLHMQQARNDHQPERGGQTRQSSSLGNSVSCRWPREKDRPHPHPGYLISAVEMAKMHVCVYVRARVCLSQHDMDEARLRSFRHASMVTLMRLYDIDCLVLVGLIKKRGTHACVRTTSAYLVWGLRGGMCMFHTDPRVSSSGSLHVRGLSQSITELDLIPRLGSHICIFVCNVYWCLNSKMSRGIYPQTRRRACR